MFEQVDFRIKLPSTLIFCGATSSGKSKLAFEVIKRRNEIFTETVGKTIYVYGEWQEAFNQMSSYDVTFTQNVFDVDHFFSLDSYTLVVIDDMFVKLNSDSQIANYISELFVQKSHHKLVIPLLICHSIFSTHLRLISLNTQIFVLFKQVRDKTTYINLGKQCYPRNPSFILEALEASTKHDIFGYIVLDFNIRSHNEFRCRNFLIPHSNMMVFTI